MELTVGHIRVASDPATVSGAPIDVVRSVVKNILEGSGSPDHVPPCGVLHPLRLPCGSTRVQLHPTTMALCC